MNSQHVFFFFLSESSLFELTWVSKQTAALNPDNAQVLNPITLLITKDKPLIKNKRDRCQPAEHYYVSLFFYLIGFEWIYLEVVDILFMAFISSRENPAVAVTRIVHGTRQ